MRIVCKTNLDAYHSDMFPSLSFVPRKGEFVEVLRVHGMALDKKGLPDRLEVVSVTYKQDTIIVELHYALIDQKIMKAKGVNPY